MWLSLEKLRLRMLKSTKMNLISLSFPLGFLLMEKHQISGFYAVTVMLGWLGWAIYLSTRRCTNCGRWLAFSRYGLTTPWFPKTCPRCGMIDPCQRSKFSKKGVRKKVPVCKFTNKWPLFFFTGVSEVWNEKRGKGAEDQRHTGASFDNGNIPPSSAGMHISLSNISVRINDAAEPHPEWHL